jgi:hypothetical protein
VERAIAHADDVGNRLNTLAATEMPPGLSTYFLMRIAFPAVKQLELLGGFLSFKM